MKKARAVLRLMRVKHYIKNILILAALACSGQLFEWERLKAGLVGFVAFSLLSSVIYIVNDIRDKEKDACHPIKKARPIASGAITVREASGLAAVLLMGAVLCNGFVFGAGSTALFLLYAVMNVGYSFGWKNIPLVDVTILTAGFLIRVLYGALITGITISDWLWLTVIALSFFFSLGKRRNELQRIGDGATRTVLNRYPSSFLDKAMYMCLGLANTFYALWCMDIRTTLQYGGINLIPTVPIVLLITMRYSMDVEGNSDGDPVEVLLRDRPLIFLCGIYLLVMLLILYVSGGQATFTAVFP